jgi:RNA recognition motif-containing protein
MNIFVGNLHYNTEERGLFTLFEEFGMVKSIELVRETHTGRFRGFAFVQMFSDSEAMQAISTLNNRTFLGRRMVVNKR